MRGRLTPWLLILWLAGCRGGEDAAVPFPAEPSRIVCASPAVAEIVFALGAGDRVAAVADFTDWPPEAAEKPRIGGALSPSRERILALQADLILSQGRSEALAALAREHRIAFFSLPLDTLSDVRAAIAGCAARLNAEERGRRLLREFDAGLAALPRREPVPVLIALGHSPGDLSGLMTTGAGTFLHDIVELAGGRNVFKDVPLPWPRISRESLLRRAPALVLDLPGRRPSATTPAVPRWPPTGSARLCPRPGPDSRRGLSAPPRPPRAAGCRPDRRIHPPYLRNSFSIIMVIIVCKQ